MNSSLKVFPVSMLVLSLLVGCERTGSSNPHEASSGNVSAETVSVSPASRRSPEYSNCIKSSKSRVDDTRCQNMELERVDARLNEAYQRALNRVQEFRRPDLEKMQQIWLQYRDAKCSFYYHRESGSGGQNDDLDCRIDTTQGRVRELDDLY